VRRNSGNDLFLIIRILPLSVKNEGKTDGKRAVNGKINKEKKPIENTTFFKIKYAI